MLVFAAATAHPTRKPRYTLTRTKNAGRHGPNSRQRRALLGAPASKPRGTAYLPPAVPGADAGWGVCASDPTDDGAAVGSGGA